MFGKVNVFEFVYECIFFMNLYMNVFFQDSLPEKLAIYEKNIDEFDAFVDTLQ